jgi:ribosome-binding factor A
MALAKKEEQESAFRELRSLAGFLEAVLASLLGPRIAAEVAFQKDRKGLVRPLV